MIDKDFTVMKYEKLLKTEKEVNDVKSLIHKNMKVL